MEVPEKLYFGESDKGILDIYSSRESIDEIEYTCTEAFIEKACNAYCKVCGHFVHTVPTHICRHDCKYFSDFKKYIEE